MHVRLLEARFVARCSESSEFIAQRTDAGPSEVTDLDGAAREQIPSVPLNLLQTSGRED